RQHFGYDSFRGCQQEVIEHVSGGGHGLLIAPTGSGKSICYQIPAVAIETDPLQTADADAARQNRGGDLVLVLSPLIALMQDQVQSLQRRGIAATVINSSLTAEQRQQRYQAIASGRFSIVFVTPERF